MIVRIDHQYIALDSKADSVSSAVARHEVTLFQIRQFLPRDQQTNRPALPWNPLYESISFQRDYHLVHRWRRHFEIALHVGFGWSEAVYLRVVEDERQVLPLFAGIRLPDNSCRLYATA